MADIPLLPRVFSFFAADPAGPVLTLPGISDDELGPISGDFAEQLSLIPDSDVDATELDSHFQFFWGHVTDPVERRRRAAEWFLTQLLTSEIPRRRLSILRRQFEVERPPPYDHPALADLTVAADRLVSVTEFDVRDGVLQRNGYVFSLVPPVESPNSQYWLMRAALSAAFADHLFVRLDPFLWGPVEEFQPMAYKMLCYGQTLDWPRIRELRHEEHGRWLPGQLSCVSEYTDYAWTPRDGEIHFQCEELPFLDSIGTRGSRYLHAIYHPKDDMIIHLDGAVRIYSADDWEARRPLHVRNAGKCGVRAKVFRVDHQITRDALSEICPQFFVWNHDVARYFGANIPAEL